jgi:hypothetical protein
MVETAWHDITTKDVDPETAQGDAYSAYAYATQLAEVEVDTETGKVEVLRMISATDVGKAINLRNRVRSYFHAPNDQAPKVQRMVDHIVDLEFIVTGSELEA